MDINPTITPNETEFINTLVRDFLNHPLCSTNHDQKNPWFKQAAAPRKVIFNDLQILNSTIFKAAFSAYSLIRYAISNNMIYDNVTFSHALNNVKEVSMHNVTNTTQSTTNNNYTPQFYFNGLQFANRSKYLFTSNNPDLISDTSSLIFFKIFFQGKRNLSKDNPSNSMNLILCSEDLTQLTLLNSFEDINISDMRIFYSQHYKEMKIQGKTVECKEIVNLIKTILDANFNLEIQQINTEIANGNILINFSCANFYNEFKIPSTEYLSFKLGSLNKTLFNEDYNETFYETLISHDKERFSKIFTNFQNTFGKYINQEYTKLFKKSIKETSSLIEFIVKSEKTIYGKQHLKNQNQNQHSKLNTKLNSKSDEFLDPSDIHIFEQLEKERTLAEITVTKKNMELKKNNWLISIDDNCKILTHVIYSFCKQHAIPICATYFNIFWCTLLFRVNIEYFYKKTYDNNYKRLHNSLTIKKLFKKSTDQEILDNLMSDNNADNPELTNTFIKNLANLLQNNGMTLIKNEPGGLQHPVRIPSRNSKANRNLTQNRGRSKSRTRTRTFSRSRSQTRTKSKTNRNGKSPSQKTLSSTRRQNTQRNRSMSRSKSRTRTRTRSRSRTQRKQFSQYSRNTSRSTSRKRRTATPNPRKQKDVNASSRLTPKRKSTTSTKASDSCRGIVSAEFAEQLLCHSHGKQRQARARAQAQTQAQTQIQLGLHPIQPSVPQLCSATTAKNLPCQGRVSAEFADQQLCHSHGKQRQTRAQAQALIQAQTQTQLGLHPIQPSVPQLCSATTAKNLPCQGWVSAEFAEQQLCHSHGRQRENQAQQVQVQVQVK